MVIITKTKESIIRLISIWEAYVISDISKPVVIPSSGLFLEATINCAPNQEISIMQKYIENCISGITANAKKCYDDVERSTGPVTAMAPYIGYQRSAAIAKESLKTGASVREIILRDGIMTEDELCKLLDARAMTEPRKIVK